jgi:hypothetical protein
MELRFVPVRIGDVTNLLGPGRDGPVHTTYRRIWHRVRECRWSGIVPDVPTRDPAAAFTEVSEHRQRSPLSVSSVAGQPPGA